MHEGTPDSIQKKRPCGMAARQRAERHAYTRTREGAGERKEQCLSPKKSEWAGGGCPRREIARKEKKESKTGREETTGQKEGYQA